MSKSWEGWTPPSPLAKFMESMFAKCDLWGQEELFACFPETEGLTRNDFFREGMYDNDDWPWTTFKAEPKDRGLKLGCRYLRKRPSWQPSNNSDSPEVPRITTIKEILSLVESGLLVARTLYPRKLAQIVIGNFERTRDRLRNELDHLHHDWRTP